MAEEQLRLQQEIPSRVERRVFEEDVPEKSNKPKLGLLNVICILGVAILLDIISIFPAVNDITDIIADIIFIPWFYFSGITFTGKRMASFGITTAIEAAPFGSVIPMITINVIYCLYYSD